MTTKFKVGQRVKTRDGRDARILAVDLKGECPVGAAVDNGAGETLERYTASGRFYGDNADSDFDLIKPPVVRVYDAWVNMYPNGVIGAYATRDSADSCATASRIACLHIRQEYEEGEGL